MKKPDHTNQLINESSPYLLQHAHNPVDWRPWNDKSLDEAKEKNQLLLISVGYSACHWCHVMEHESFENAEVAAIMNTNYISVKVDREERPDVDQVYMNAVQAMTGMGGWPMNVVALPDGRPVWGGTYFQKDQWKSALTQIAHLYENQPEKLLEYAEKLEEGLSQMQIIEIPENKKKLEKSLFDGIISKWKSVLDHKNGGYNRSPKFMMPSNYDFLLKFAHQEKDKELLKYVQHTFDKISWGGVYDPIDGGFSRYSVDEKWHVPHFEKMLYDSAQLVSSYANLYKLTRNKWYADVVEKTLKFVETDLQHQSGAFYSALDADSENGQGHSEEGAYYVWTKDELMEILEDDYELFSEVYHIDAFGRWEKDHYVLIRTKSLEQLSANLNLSKEELSAKLKALHEKLGSERSKRAKPGLDDKSITSWNAMMISGYCHAFQALQNENYLVKAEAAINFILKNSIQPDGRLFHTYKNGKSIINAYLEDYAFVIQALLDLYESSFKEYFLDKAQELLEILEHDFKDEKTGLFYFTSSMDRALINRIIDVQDNVIPAANSVMANNYYKLGKLTGKIDLTNRSEKMLQAVLPGINDYAQSYSNWLLLLLNFTHPFYEVAITGDNSVELAKGFQEQYLPHKVLAASKTESDFGILKDRLKSGDSLIYICEHGNCQLPVHNLSEALGQMN
ncbi:thioredoxin domain-containing protein [uncultured Christiangramia sp.]|uniref:thioredoxin domain-containing protein n=1 Tax=uncultured Christiangramia sp. TaxID=503836 RepID=UPI0026337983|nr:thioredoxin domain-containing protein [uncultured Christiangramia sp.]